MRKILLLIFYAAGAFLFIRFFIAPLYHILAVLFFGGLIVLIFFSRRAGPDSDFLNIMRLVSVFLWLADIFGFVSFGTLNFTLGIFLVFL
ncbi:MAG: hypothetical protein Q8L57_03820, partial [bacterium]|nr:hypothetical protein [bacterium]